METLRFFNDSINERHIDRAVNHLRDGHIILYPTDTLYALGCDALNQRAIERLCRLKGLNTDKNLLSIVCADLSQAAEYARIDNKAFSVMRRYLPGPFTFVLPASTRLPKVFKGRKTVGVRIPDNAIARALARELGNPLMTASVDAPSADAEDISNPDALGLAYDGHADILLDGGYCGMMPSAIIDMTGDMPEVLREGPVEFEE